MVPFLALSAPPWWGRFGTTFWNWFVPLSFATTRQGLCVALPKWMVGFMSWNGTAKDRCFSESHAIALAGSTDPFSPRRRAFVCPPSRPRNWSTRKRNLLKAVSVPCKGEQMSESTWKRVDKLHVTVAASQYSCRCFCAHLRWATRRPSKANHGDGIRWDELSKLQSLWLSSRTDLGPVFRSPIGLILGRHVLLFCRWKLGGLIKMFSDLKNRMGDEKNRALKKPTANDQVTGNSDPQCNKHFKHCSRFCWRVRACPEDWLTPKRCQR